MGIFFSSIFDGLSGGGGSSYPEVTTFAGLPAAGTASGEVYLVKTTTGVIFVNRKPAGLYRSDGSVWTFIGDTANLPRTGDTNWTGGFMLKSVAATGTQLTETNIGVSSLNDITNVNTLELVELTTAPGTPTAGDAVVYMKTDGKLYLKDDTGAETDLTAGGSGSTAWGDITGTLANQTDLSNALGDKLESSDISDFETTTELNARDTANRSRANHTGTQAIATVTGLQDALDNKQPLNSTLTNTTASFTTALETKLNNIEVNADVTDTINVTAAGALMDSELTDLAGIKALNTSTLFSGDYNDLTNKPIIPDTESIQDTVGGMVTTNTETLITVTYQDIDGTLDFVVDNNLANYDNTTSGFITDYTVTEADVTTHEAALTITESQISDLGSYLVSADIANFETTTELNTRDTNNRNRANHTGTQAQSTVTNLETDLAGKIDETVARAVGTTNTQTGTTYTLQNSDSGKILTFNNASAITVTIPSGLDAGFNITWVQKGAGTVTFSDGVGVTLSNRQGHTASAGQHAVGGLVADVADNYYLTGDTA